MDGRASLPESDDGVSRATDQSVPEEEEDQISFEKAWTRTRGHTLRFGETISEDKRLQKILQREYFMLTVIAPRVRGLSDAIREWSRSSASHSVWVSCVVVTILHVAFSVGCATAFGGMCAGGPELAEDDTDYEWATTNAFTEYGPPMLNALATLLLSFYANVCMGLYKDGYFSAQTLKESVFDITAMVAGTIPDNMIEVRMEFWRTINLYHLCSYVLADKTRMTYNLDNFLVPVATAYGEYDGRSNFGMLRLGEIEVLATDPVSAMSYKSLRSGLAADHRPSEYARKESTVRRAIWGQDRVNTDQERAALEKEKSLHRSMRRRQRVTLKGSGGSSRLTRFTTRFTSREKSEVMGDDNDHATEGVPEIGKPSRKYSADTAALKPTVSLANMRGDVGSNAAVLHAALGVRLYQLINFVIDEKLSRAAWPAWNALAIKLRSNAEGLKQRALYRLPRIYQAAVRIFVAFAILLDTIYLGSRSARLLRHAHDDNDAWMVHAYFGAFVDLLVNVLLTWTCAVFLDAIGDMQTPFGSEQFDMPGLSYVTAAAELSLRTVRGGRPTSAHEQLPPNARLFRMLNGGFNRERLLSSTHFQADKYTPDEQRADNGSERATRIGKTSRERAESEELADDGGE